MGWKNYERLIRMMIVTALIKKKMTTDEILTGGCVRIRVIINESRRSCVYGLFSKCETHNKRQISSGEMEI